MNRKRAKELLPIIQAFADGKMVQANLYGRWHDINDSVSFECDWNLFRIKPEPREFWLCNVDDKRNANHYWITKEQKDSGHWDQTEHIKVREVIE